MESPLGKRSRENTFADLLDHLFRDLQFRHQFMVSGYHAYQRILPALPEGSPSFCCMYRSVFLPGDMEDHPYLYELCSECQPEDSSSDEESDEGSEDTGEPSSSSEEDEEG